MDSLFAKTMFCLRHQPKSGSQSEYVKKHNLNKCNEKIVTTLQNISVTGKMAAEFRIRYTMDFKQNVSSKLKSDQMK